MQVKGNNKENYFQNDYRIHWHENGERSNKYFLNLEKRKHVKIQCRNWKLMALVGLHNNNTNTGKYNLYHHSNRLCSIVLARITQSFPWNFLVVIMPKVIAWFLSKLNWKLLEKYCWTKDKLGCLATSVRPVYMYKVRCVKTVLCNSILEPIETSKINLRAFELWFQNECSVS